MQKWVIVGVVFMLFGCAKSDEDKCRDEGKYWDASAKECKDKAPEGTPAPVETQESCKLKQGYVWHTNNSQCKRVDYFMIIHPENLGIFSAFIQLKEEREFLAKNHTYIRRGECIKVPESFLSYVIVKAKSNSTVPLSEICSNASASEKKCELGVYNLAVEGNDVKLEKITFLEAERTDCKLLEIPSE